MQVTKPGDGWIITRSGIAIDYGTPASNQYVIEDIAYALSMICRWAGHSKKFMSVAQHSCIVADLLWDDPEIAYQGLMHDAAEAYLGDINNPLKALLPDYKVLEAKFEKAIMEKFRVPYPHNSMVKQADMVSLAWEARDMIEWGNATHLKLPAPPEEKLVAIPSQFAEEQFLARFRILIGMPYINHFQFVKPMARW